MRVYISSRESFKAESSEVKARFYRKDRLLNFYAFACGYIECYRCKTKDRSFNVDISKDSCAYLVRGFFGEEHIYKAFDKPSEARKYIRGRIAEIRKNA